MREITVAIDDEALYSAVQAQATFARRSVQDIVVDTLRESPDDAELVERERIEVEAAQKGLA